MQPRRIALVLFDSAELLDFGGAASVFNFASRLEMRTPGSASPTYQTDYFSVRGGLVRTVEGLEVATVPLPRLRKDELDTVIVSGGPTATALSQKPIADWLRANRRGIQRVGAVCTGAFILAEAGLLNGRRAATHWDDCAELQKRYPEIDVDGDSIFVEDHGIWTSAGVTAGIDMALRMVQEDCGYEIAFQVARQMVVFLQRPGGQSQFSALLQSQATPGPLAPLLAWMVSNPCENLRVETLADRANMSVRSFYRAFESATGNPPAEWVERMRVEAARRLLEQSQDRIEQIALRTGFVSYERMRRAFARRVGVSPASYRARFSRGCTRPPPEE